VPQVVIDGVEYVPRAEILPLTDGRLKACLESLTEIQYFSDQRHKHRAWAWDALNALSPELAALAGSDPEKAYERVHGTDR
jgi:hypothetical protein